MKLRVQNSPAHIAIFRSLGANPVAIAWGEPKTFEIDPVHS
jgi:TRAP-type C4-dicarboxylate transport system substrate-binding protein